MGGAPVVAGARIGGFVLTAPIASEATMPAPVKIALSIGLAFVLSPLAPVPAGLSIFSGAGVLAAVQEIVIGDRDRHGGAARVRGARLSRARASR